ncbi:hypothetical protein OC834_007456, partial [Tilletia horrida]
AECVVEAAELEKIYDSTITGSRTKVFEQNGHFMKENAVKRVVHKAGIQRYIAGASPALSASAIEKRKKWALQDRATDWRRIIFMEEYSLNTSNLRR